MTRPASGPKVRAQASECHPATSHDASRSTDAVCKLLERGLLRWRQGFVTMRRQPATTLTIGLGFIEPLRCEFGSKRFHGKHLY